MGSSVKVSDINNNFQYSLSPPHDDGDKGLMSLPLSVTTDREDNAYIPGGGYSQYSDDRDDRRVF